jgi:hypothetical protein
VASARGKHTEGNHFLTAAGLRAVRRRKGCLELFFANPCKTSHRGCAWYFRWRYRSLSDHGIKLSENRTAGYDSLWCSRNLR